MYRSNTILLPGLTLLSYELLLQISGSKNFSIIGIYDASEKKLKVS